jgi:hypothetical protein
MIQFISAGTQLVAAVPPQRVCARPAAARAAVSGKCSRWAKQLAAADAGLQPTTSAREKVVLCTGTMPWLQRVFEAVLSAQVLSLLDKGYNLYSPGAELGQAVEDLVQSEKGSALAEASLQAEGTWEVRQIPQTCPKRFAADCLLNMDMRSLTRN